MKGFSSNTLINLLGDIEKNLIRYHDLTIAQAAILETDNTDMLTANINERQKIINLTERLQQEAIPLLQLYDHNKLESVPDAPEREKIDKCRETIRETIQKTEQADSKNREKAGLKKELYAAEIKKLHKSRKSLRLYNQSELANEPVFIDNKK